MKLRNKKTGEIWDIGKIITNDYPSYETLKQINDNFEDYEPAEPLIKDGKVRKAIRLWTELNGIDKVHHYLCDGSSCFIFTDKKDNDCSLDFTFKIDNLISNADYTITELIGGVKE